MEDTLQSEQVFEPIIINFKDKIFRYNFSDLEIEQAEMCREIGELKYHQIQNPPASVNDLIKSQGAQYTSYLGALLFKEIVNDIPKEFNADIAQTQTLKFFKALPVSEYSKLEVSIKDFFTNIGRDIVGLSLFQREKKRSEIETLQILATLMNTNQSSNQNNTQKSLNENNLSGI